MSDQSAFSEQVAEAMRELGLSTGHGDTLAELLEELRWQVEELQDGLRRANELIAETRGGY